MPAFMPSSTTTEYSVTTSSQALALPVPGGDALRIEAPQSGNVRFAFGTSGGSVTLTNGMGLLDGSVETFSVPYGATHILVIASSACTLRVTPGMGM